MMQALGLTRRNFFTELRHSSRGCRLRLSLGLALFEEGFCLNLFGFLIPLLFLDRLAYDPHEIMESWGFCLFERSIHLRWGRHCKIVHLPWEFEHLKCEVMRPDGSWVPYVASYEDKEPDGRWEGNYAYSYRLRSGELQVVSAKVYVERREWRWRWLMWCPWPAMKRQSIDVAFSDEVGEQRGSWKGGTLGCGYDMLPGELPIQTLRRMERERVFN